jgi:hypothetical protein
MNKEQQELLDEVYKNFVNTIETNRPDGYIRPVISKEEFIFESKIHPEFSEKWGLKIEERELNLDERAKLHSNTEMFYDICATHFSIQDSIEYSNYPDKIWLHEQFTKGNIPTKLITITYNNETIESYEYNR